jgi:hypothetical protein
MLDVPGICDRCGQRYLLKELKEISILSSGTNSLVCENCWEPSHPQLDTRGVRTDDKQSVRNSRSDAAELPAVRALFSWNPVGCDATSILTGYVGRVTAT